ncbi:MAG TPA: hypothetical protein VFJ18_11450, partial [Pararhizobium sp.]|nr:hypothetical protein [Pararhizobium sp.]
YVERLQRRFRSFHGLVDRLTDRLIHDCLRSGEVEQTLQPMSFTYVDRGHVPLDATSWRPDWRKMAHIISRARPLAGIRSKALHIAVS